MTRGVWSVSSSFSISWAGLRQHEDRLKQLEEQARQDSRTSSKPPSADPPQARGVMLSVLGMGGVVLASCSGRKAATASCARSCSARWRWGRSPAGSCGGTVRARSRCPTRTCSDSRTLLAVAMQPGRELAGFFPKRNDVIGGDGFRYVGASVTPTQKRLVFVRRQN